MKLCHILSPASIEHEIEVLEIGRAIGIACSFEVCNLMDCNCQFFHLFRIRVGFRQAVPDMFYGSGMGHGANVSSSM